MSDKEQVIQALRATLISVKGSLTLNQCNRDYRELQGEFIPYQKLGYSSLENLFQRVPGFSIAQVNGEWVVDAIASRETQHIASMVARQKSNKRRPGRFNYGSYQIMARGAGRGRYLPGRGGMGRPPFNRPRVLTLRPPFDLILAEPAFPRCKPALDDSALTQALLKRHAELCPTPVEQWVVVSLVTKLQTVLDNLAVVPGDFAACQLEDVRQVGSYKKGTMMTGKNVADIVVIMKTLPTKEAVAGLSNMVNEELNKLMRAEGLGNVSSACHERGFTVSASAAAVRVLVTTLHQNMRRLEPEVHLEYEVINSHLAAIRHSRWFEENAHHSSIKVLIRLLRDMCARHSGLEPLTPWMIDLLAHHCIMNNPARQALPINVAFRRALSLLASGLFLPGGAGLPDPCEAAHASVHAALDLPALDHAAATAQTLLRIVARGGHRYVLGLQPFEGGKDISTEITVWDGVVVSPLAPAYQETPEPMDTDDKAEGA